MLRVRWLGRVPYDEALSLQRALAWRAHDDYLLFLEHPHVYTLGVRADPANILIDVSSVGATVAVTERGGDVTYHGPGQLVLYPILTLPDHPGAGPEHVRRLEEVVISALKDLGIDKRTGGVGRLAEYPGIWVGVNGKTPKKLGAIGVKTLRGETGDRRSLHGLALNVDCDLSMFDHIVPCGINHLPVTSLRNEGIEVSMGEVVDAVAAQAATMWSTEPFERVDVTSGSVERSAKIALRVAPPHPGLGASSTPIELGQKERPLLQRLRQSGVDPDAGLQINERKPSWLRIPARIGEEYLSLSRTIHDRSLVTVCEEAGCPNIYECWSQGTATFMVNGERCTRACGFCQVDTRHPLALDEDEPARVADAVGEMKLAHAVITCVARDDLADGGAGAIAETVRAVRDRCPATTIEVLISDCKGDAASLGLIFEARPDILNHNIETVARLQRAVRPSAGYARSLSVLARAADAGLVTKSGMMVGLGEDLGEVTATLHDLAAVGVSIATVGQYLRPTRDHLPVARWWTPEEFATIAEIGRSAGLTHVESSPLTRSSYHARGAAVAVGIATDSLVQSPS